MKRSCLPLAAVMLAAVLVPAAAAAAGQAAELCTFDELAKKVRLTDTQRAKMSRVLAELDRKLAAWDSANADRRQRAEAALTRARDGRNAEELCKALDRRQAIQDERARIVDAGKAELLALLTPAQRATWQGHVLFQQMHETFKPFGLDKTQIADISSLCHAAADRIAELTAKGSTRDAARAAETLEREIAQNVLRTSQRERYAGRAASSHSSPREGETDAERAERIRLAVIGFTGERQAADQAKSLKSTKDAMGAAIADADRRWREGIDPKDNDGNGRGDLLRLINEERRARGLKPFSNSQNLNGNAQRRANSLTGNNRSSRNKGRKKKNSGRNRSQGNTGGVEAVVRGPSNVRSAFNALMKNSAARGKILSSSYRSIGLGRSGSTWVAKFGR